MKKRLSKGLRKYIRQEKTRFHREVSDLTEQKKLIEEIYEKIGLKFQNTKTSNRSKNKKLAERSK